MKNITYTQKGGKYVEPAPFLYIYIFLCGCPASNQTNKKRHTDWMARLLRQTKSHLSNSSQSFARSIFTKQSIYVYEYVTAQRGYIDDSHRVINKIVTCNCFCLLRSTVSYVERFGYTCNLMVEAPRYDDLTNRTCLETHPFIEEFASTIESDYMQKGDG